MSNSGRPRARALCHDSLARGDALGWFDKLYAEAAGDSAVIPWADLVPNPHLVDWHLRSGFDFSGKSCLKVGCGLGDDCEYLAQHGGTVTGFDISKTAIDWCHQRFPNSVVEYHAADLFTVPGSWSNRFEFVIESYTLQVLPAELRRRAIPKIAEFLAPGGTLLVVCRGREPGGPQGEMPWPLTREELSEFQSSAGLEVLSVEEFLDDEVPPVPRIRAAYRRRETNRTSTAPR